MPKRRKYSNDKSKNVASEMNLQLAANTPL
jgi:hypothetical protein